MLDVLDRAEAALPILLEEPLESWNSLDVDYEPPRVERLWRPFEDKYRLMLHRIHPCEKALYHPHPWPSAVRIIDGHYEMGVAVDGAGDLAKLILEAESFYEMVNPHAWHYVKPLGDTSLSIMVTGPLYVPQVYNHADFGKHRDLSPLTDAAKKDLLACFKQHCLTLPAPE